MKASGRIRRQLIASLVPRDRVVIDVGADHGYLAAAVGAIATERMPHRRGRAAVPWVVCDGLRAFRQVDVAVITGMGAHVIQRILHTGPRPQCAVVHAPDDAAELRRLLAADGWRIEAEGLAPDGRAYAEVLRVVAGEESASGYRLEYGPILLESSDPLLVPHLEHRLGALRAIIDRIADHNPVRSRDLRSRASFLDDSLRRAKDRAQERSSGL